MTIRSRPEGGNLGYYRTDSDPISYNRKWVWHNGGGTFSCWRQTIIPGVLYIDFQLLIPPSEGVLLPAPTEPSSTDPGGGGSGGGGTYSVPGIPYTPPLPPPDPGTDVAHLYCMVTDWYENGLYTDTTYDYCWIEIEHIG